MADLTIDERRILTKATEGGRYYVSVREVREKRGDYLVCLSLANKGLGRWDLSRWYLEINSQGFHALGIDVGA